VVSFTVLPFRVRASVRARMITVRVMVRVRARVRSDAKNSTEDMCSCCKTNIFRTIFVVTLSPYSGHVVSCLLYRLLSMILSGLVLSDVNQSCTVF
jgi:hypothetical protein